MILLANKIAADSTYVCIYINKGYLDYYRKTFFSWNTCTGVLYMCQFVEILLKIFYMLIFVS